jgi:hypothetical protein
MFSDDEVGAVVKAGITVAAQTEFVLITLLVSLFKGQFDAGCMAHLTAGSRSGRIPVVGRSRSRHLVSS